MFTRKIERRIKRKTKHFVEQKCVKDDCLSIMQVEEVHSNTRYYQVILTVKEENYVLLETENFEEAKNIFTVFIADNDWHDFETDEKRRCEAFETY